jgi:hypothetical protein
MKTVHLILYGALGIVYLGLGAASFLLFGEGSTDPEVRHLYRELGASGVFVGLMCLWCVGNYARRRFVHSALLLFTLLFAVIHWMDWCDGLRPIGSGLVNSVPFMLLLTMSFGMKRAESKDGA